MSYVELEQFLDRGSIRAWWGLSWRTFFGCAGGAVLGQQLGTVLFGTNMAGVATLTLVGAALGLTLLLKRRGIIVARRLLVLATFGLRVARKRTLVDGALLAGRVDAHAPPPIQIRVREARAPWRRRGGRGCPGAARHRRRSGERGAAVRPEAAQP